MLNNIIKDAAQFTIQNEGCFLRMYRDSEGIPTIGIGFNLLRKDAKEKLNEINRELRLVISGRDTLNLDEVLWLFDQDYGEAKEIAKRVIPHFNDLSYDRKMAFVDMAFNLGETRLRKFKRMIAALEKKDYMEAAAEAKDSKWYTQVKSRGYKVVELIAMG